jgi:dolichol-phosphate mannosyltransferase
VLRSRPFLRARRAEPDAAVARAPRPDIALTAAAACATTALTRLPLPDLSVVVPVHNEVDNVTALIEEIHAALAGGVDFEAIFVDDASSDDTPLRLRELARRFPRLRVLRHRRNAGQSTAIVTGVRAARGHLVATLDGDGQNDPADIPALLARWRDEGGDEPGRPPLLLAGWRASRNDTWLRRLSSRIANGVRARLLGDGTPDTGCGLKLFARETFLQLPYFDHMHRFLPALVIRSGGRVVSVPVRHRPRTRGQSHYGVWNRLWVGLVDLAGVMWLRRRTRLTEVETLADAAAGASGPAAAR